ncbi:ferric-chelate reductase protein [Rutstroemia sp. NJR-2017a BBW]|nr:ferric-chelate reductase protein [Rutstroemia sp. NJR-2017a BBW]
MGLPWLDSPLMLHSSGEHICNLTAAQCEYESDHWRDGSQADHVYGYATICFMCAVIGVYSLAHWGSIFTHRWSFYRSRVWLRIRAMNRYLSCKLFYIKLLDWCSPSLGVMILGAVGLIFFFSLSLGPGTYYWPGGPNSLFGDSVPLSFRSAFIALGILPFIPALASKINYITLLTGVSHQKLQVFHRWTSWAMFVLALMHTFPLVVSHIQKGDITTQWKTKVQWWTGVATLVPQAWLSIMSIGPIRNTLFGNDSVCVLPLHTLQFSTFFLVSSVGPSISSFGLLNRDYLIAALSVYLSTVLYSMIKTFFLTRLHYATVSVLPGNTISLHLPTAKFRWSPAQHVFLRLLHPTLRLHILTSHPFTICSLPSKDSKQSIMTFCIRPSASHSSLTSRLARLASATSVPVLIDGPYGDSGIVSKLNMFEKRIFVAGGSGIGFLLPILQGLRRQDELSIIVVLKDRLSAEWVRDSIEDVLEVGSKDVLVQIYVTGGSMSVNDATSSDPESELEKDGIPSDTDWEYKDKAEEKRGDVRIIERRGRPDLKEIVRGECEDSMRIGVVACGPRSLMGDVKEACAGEQWGILRRGVDKEVWFHGEDFSW